MKHKSYCGGALLGKQMCSQLENLRMLPFFFFRLAYPKIFNCQDKIKTGKQKEKRNLQKRSRMYFLFFFFSFFFNVIDTPSV